MGDQNTSIISLRSTNPGKEEKAQEILDWLIQQNIVSPVQTDCTLGSEGYAIAKGALDVLSNPGDDNAFGLLTNGLEIVLERTVFYNTGGLDDVRCPSCHFSLGGMEGEHVSQWLDEWDGEAKDHFECPSCQKATDLNEYLFEPEWGVSDLGFNFWNWGELKESFVAEFARRLGSPVKVVHTKI